MVIFLWNFDSMNLYFIIIINLRKTMSRLLYDKNTLNWITPPHYNLYIYFQNITYNTLILDVHLFYNIILHDRLYAI